MANGFMGLVSPDDIPSTQRENDWKLGYLEAFPAGDVSLTGLTSLMEKKVKTDNKFYWHDQVLGQEEATLQNNGIYDDANLNTAYTSGGAIGTVVWAKILRANAQEIREGHQVLLMDADTETNNVPALVTAVQNFNDTNWKVGCKLTKAGGTGLASADRLVIMGNANSSGSSAPGTSAPAPRTARST